MNRMYEWLSEEEMPDRNVDGTPMVNGVDLNGRPYGRSAAWEDDPWHVAAARVFGPSPLGKAWELDHVSGAAIPRISCTVFIVVIDRRRCRMRRRMRGVRPSQCGARFHRSASSRRARRKRRDSANRHRCHTWLWIAIRADAMRFDGGSAPSMGAGQ